MTDDQRAALLRSLATLQTVRRVIEQRPIRYPWVAGTIPAETKRRKLRKVQNDINTILIRLQAGRKEK